MQFDENLVFLNLKANSDDEVLTILAKKLVDLGYVTKQYLPAVLEREKKFPTGLPTVPFGVAIPHTDADKVKEAQVAFALLENPVKFKTMGNSNCDTEVKLVFMLALKSPEDQLDMLQKLIGVFNDEEKVLKLSQVKTPEEYFQILSEIYKTA